ncbi:MAG: asparagine synthase (glutamine-hydrolyzing) [Lachnospiraceae bacterium]|nr:asparagine synthase (glutamine-hydrolyzing) [Lachnospiraceae bacterium]
MCGINGIISKSSIGNIEDRIKKMNQAIEHRGPNADNYAILKKEKIALGHRRLAIIDLDERSNQPFTSSSGRWIVVYNGEIYNYKELKAEVAYPYTTESDTEVLAAYLEKKGIDELLRVCNGMFAFAAYDTEKNEIYLCRDRLGIKPLYYYCGNSCLIFSSEVKGILNSGLVEAVLDEESIDDYLAYRYVREPYTFFKNIYQVEAGTYKKINYDNQIMNYRYWDIPDDFNFNKEYDENHISQLFQRKLKNAVNKRMIADVPLGTYLSGGIDSSLLSAIVAEETEEKINTYTIGFPHLNEFEYARMVAKKYDTEHHELKMDWNEYQEKMEKVICYKDAPLGVPNEIPLAVMSEELRKKITVVLSGEGADELLGGYGRIFRTPFDYLNYDKHCEKTFYQYFIDRYEYVPRQIRDNYLINKSSRRLKYDCEIAESFEKRSNEYNVFRFFHKYHVKGLLQRVDTTTMLAGVEARVPFLDHELIEFVYKEVPYDMKLKWKSDKALYTAKNKSAGEYSEDLDIPKYLLKKISYKYLPKEVIERKKMGFPVPLKEWHDNMKDMAQKYLKNSNIIKSEKLDELMCDCEKEKIGDQIIWMFINLEIFHQLYFLKEWRY